MQDINNHSDYKKTGIQVMDYYDSNVLVQVLDEGINVIVKDENY